MGSKKARDYDTIIKVLQDIEKEMDNLSNNGKKLRTQAQAAESALRDRVAKKNIDNVVSLGDNISKLAANGDQQIKELIRAIKQDKAAFEELDR